MNPNNRSEVDGLFTDGDLTTLVDLQKFLAEELAQGAEQGVDLSRAFTPLTDGLGIHPSHKPAPAGAAKAGEPVFVAPSPAPVTEFRTPTPEKEKARPSTRLIIDDALDSARPSQEDFSVSPPPPVPAVGLGRRFMSGMVDQLFVWTAWLLALAITSNAMAGTSGDFGQRLVRELSNAAFLRSAGLEFAMIWVGYLVLSFGILEMTFGMWVWGLRINYGEERRGWKKLARVLMGLLFYPTVIPTVLLAFRKDDKHVLDAVTHSSVYRILQN